MISRICVLLQRADISVYEKLLRSDSLFGRFSPDHLFYFASNFLTVDFPARSLLIKKGQLVDGIYLIISGINYIIRGLCLYVANS